MKAMTENRSVPGGRGSCRAAERQIGAASVALVDRIRLSGSFALPGRQASLPLHLPSREGDKSTRRRGISLLEVLISMFVMLFSLMGVAAMFPVGNHYAAQGAKYDRASSAAPMAFAEMKTRGMLRPERWAYGVNTALANGGGTNSTPYYFISPAGTTTPGYFFRLPPTATSVSVPSVGRAFVLDPLGADRKSVV